MSRVITLFTNLTFVTVNDAVRVHCGALILEPEEKSNPGASMQLGSAAKIRGFLYGSTSPTLDLWPPSLEYEVAQAQSQHVFIGGSGEPRPLMDGVVLTFRDGPALSLVRATHDDRPIKVEQITGASHAELYDLLWSTLDARILEYTTTPARPRVIFEPNPRCRY